ncbi:MAG TPA: SPOR domain-containing protein, partial [Steroidobacteraceae bacterium]|nr:SPOR domain-containing protein [Steroidobacteraceae bacterium]
RHPDSELAGVARQRIAQLTEEAAWQQATRANTAAAYQQYLAKYPGGSWSQEARIRMESLSLTRGTTGAGGAVPHGPEAVSGSPSVGPAMPGSASSGPAGASPSGKRAATAASSTASGRSTVQLGAFSSAGNANMAWSRLSSRFRPQLRGLTPRVVPVSVSGRRLYRLEVSVADRAAARRLCRQLAERSQGCLPLP